MDPTTLPLRDIHLPPPVSWWPPAPGWWVLAACVLIATLGIVGGITWRRRQAQRRAGTAELVHIERAYATDADGHACAQALSRLLRRLTLAAAPEDTGALRGDAWYALLAAHAGRPLPASVRAVVERAPYSPAAAAALDRAAYDAALRDLRAWLVHWRAQPRRGASVPRAAAAPATATSTDAAL